MGNRITRPLDRIYRIDMIYKILFIMKIVQILSKVFCPQAK